MFGQFPDALDIDNIRIVGHPYILQLAALQQRSEIRNLIKHQLNPKRKKKCNKTPPHDHI
jgi:hypothetical protein